MANIVLTVKDKIASVPQDAYIVCGNNKYTLILDLDEEWEIGKLITVRFKSLIDIKVERTDVEVFYVPTTQMARDNEIATLANMIIVGHLLQNHPELSFAGTDDVVTKLVPAKKAALVELNKKALALGKEYTN